MKKFLIMMALAVFCLNASAQSIESKSAVKRMRVMPIPNI